jgi:hypothetical protein
MTQVRDRVVTKPSTQRDTHTLTVRMPREVYEALRTYAFASEKTLNESAVTAMLHFLAHEGRQQEVTAFLDKARRDYRVALDKLADL